MYTPNKDNPLTQDDLDAINNVLEHAGRHADLIQKCENCGLPVQDHKERNRQHIELATAIKKEFFPLEL